MNKSISTIRKPFISITYKVILSVTLFILLAASIVSYLVFFEIQQQNTQNKINELKRITEYQTKDINYEFKLAGEKLRAISTEQEIISLLENKEENTNLYDLAKSKLTAYNVGSSYESIYLLDDSGLVIVATNPVFEGNNYGFRDYFTQVTSDSVYSTTALGITTNNMGYYFSYPIYSQKESGKLLGVIAIKIGEENIKNLFSERYGWDTSILDSRGVFIFSTDQSLVLKSLVEVPILSENIGKKESQYLGKEILSLDRNRLWQSIRLSNSIVDYKTTNFLNNGTNLYVTAMRVSNYDYFVLTSIKEEGITSSSLKFATSIAWKIMFAALIAMLFIIVSISWILSPMKKIKKFVELFVKGNYKDSIKIITFDEFESLANLLNKLQEKIMEDYVKISKSVDENQMLSQKKIKDLEKLNRLMVNREVELVRLKKEIKELKENTSNDK